ncbi:unnamed protein product [Cuscuta europaea]|uniref:TPX2 C-terminal domain-containing protein n=1 Tax=Cuscuta europaea TaxID=41803 RepID=A0A9P1EKL6_CUSEU|nr:unnamed protein product [Cuscuta europaea]
MGDLKYHDEEDCWSLTSSTAASVRTIRSKLTVPVAPSFRSVERLARRKEFYEKLGEKHKALEAEKQECASRTKEEEEAAIKQLRKNTVYKANPVPSFYKEGPPPKAELKKLPVTRAKSPNFTRRKSCGDIVTPREERKDSSRSTRHSTGAAYREPNTKLPTPNKKDQISARNINRVMATSSQSAKKSSTKETGMKETSESSSSRVEETRGTSGDVTDQPREDIAVQL